MTDAVQHKTGTRIVRLDGIRAVAIILVFLIHEDIGRFGWEGVPLFFALSGFLITGILRGSRNNPSYWVPFYVKRATRILPPLAIAFLAAALFSDVAWRKVGLYELLFAANFAELFEPHRSGTLTVLWSLAVEEQFYLLWPFAIRYLNRRRLIHLLIAILVVEPIIRAIATPMFSSIWSIYYLTPFQLDGLTGGSLLALILEDDSNVAFFKRWAGPAVGTLLLGFSLLSLMPGFSRDANTIPFNSIGYSLVSLCACSLLAYVLLRPESMTSHVLGSNVVVFLGAISYGFYLFHPVGISLVASIAKAHNFAHNRTLAPLTFCSVALISWLSYRFYELPIITWGKRAAAQLTNLSTGSGKHYLVPASISAQDGSALPTRTMPTTAELVYSTPEHNS